jgi:biotin carboxylase
MTHILIVGKSFSGLKNYLEEQGYHYTLLQDRATTKFPDKKFKQRVVADFSTPNAILAAVDLIHQKTPIDGAVTVYENYVVHTAHIATHLDLPGMSIAAAEACTDKERMRELFATAPTKISPDFAVITSEREVRDFAAQHTFPLIIKPANLSKSLLVTKSSSLEELLMNYQKTAQQIDRVYEKYAPDQTPKLLIEEFLEGPVFSVDAFVDASGEPHILENVVDYQTGYDIGYDDNFHYSRLLPSRLPADKVEAIRQAAAIGCRTLGMTSSPAHIEIIYTKEGPRIVEIGARNGGYRERMHRLANGIDTTANTLALALNQPLDITAAKNDAVGVFELFPRIPGTFQEIEGESILRSLPSLNYLSIKAHPGDYVGKSSDGYKMCAVVILANHDPAQFAKDAHQLAVEISIITTPEDQ